MAIRQKRKEVELPPAHLYLEDIEEIIRLMVEWEKTRRIVEGQEIKTAFSVGKKQCDTVEDLKKIGGIWHDFEVEVNSSTFRVSRFSGADLRVYDNGETFPKVLKLMIAREARVRSTLRRIPYIFVTLWPGVWWLVAHRIVNTPTGMAIFVVGMVLPLFMAIWAGHAHTFVELRYSHDPSPKLTWLKERGEKAGWLIVGTILGLALTWLWKHFIQQ